MCKGSERADLHPPSESSGTMDGSGQSWGRGRDLPSGEPTVMSVLRGPAFTPSATWSLLGVCSQGSTCNLGKHSCVENWRYRSEGTGLGTVSSRVTGKELTQEASRFCSLKTCLVLSGCQPFSLLGSSWVLRGAP